MKTVALYYNCIIMINSGPTGLGQYDSLNEYCGPHSLLCVSYINTDNDIVGTDYNDVKILKICK